MRQSLFLLLCFFALLSCSRKALPVMTPVANSLQLQEIDFEYLQARGRINYKDSKGERDVKTNVRIHKDSLIWMTFSVIGVQGGKVLINKDSITILSALNKEYFVFTYAELSRRFNFKVDYQVIQSAMLGNLIEPRTPDDKTKRASGLDLLEQKQGSVSIKNYINPASAKLERMELLESSSNNTVSIAYSNFQPLEDKLFPYHGVINIFYRNASIVIRNSIMFDYTKTEIGDKELKFPFTIPKKYERR